MNRISSILTLVIYTTLSVGIGLSNHFCLDFKSDVGVFSFENDGCACEGNGEEDGDCCKDELGLIVLDEEQQLLQYSYSKLPTYILLYETGSAVIDDIQLDNKCSWLNFSKNEPPPRISSLFQTNCSYIFYG